MDFKQLCQLIAADLQAHGIRPGFLRFVKKYSRSAGFAMAVRFRLSQYFYRKGWAGRQAAQWLHLGGISRGCHLSPQARIAGGLLMPHPIGIVIGEGAVVGKGAVIFHNVTLGRRTLKEGSYPTLKDNVTLYAGACLVGGITLGDGATVGANAVVLEDVAADTLVFGNPAKAKATKTKK